MRTQYIGKPIVGYDNSDGQPVTNMAGEEMQVELQVSETEDLRERGLTGPHVTLAAHDFNEGDMDRALILNPQQRDELIAALTMHAEEYPAS